MTTTLEEYEDHARRIFGDAEQIRDDVITAARYLSERPGEEFGVPDLMEVLGDDNGQRAIAVLAFVCGGSQPVADPFFMVKLADGELHEAGQVSKAQMDGREPYVFEATGEVVADPPKHLFPRFRVTGFEKRLDVSARSPM
jgi:hypothetical protein